ncbi:MAG: hypothetical protein RR692_06275 [Raoultibacter sp.]
MFEQDYLMRMFVQFMTAIRRSIQKARNENNPAAAADLLEGAIGNATEIDGGILLSLAPESMAGVIQVSGTDPRVVEYLVRSLLLEAEYLDEANQSAKADLRSRQAEALADAYGLDARTTSISPEELDAFFDETLKDK